MMVRRHQLKMCIIHDLFFLIRLILFNGLISHERRKKPTSILIVCVCFGPPAKQVCFYVAAILAALTNGLRTHLQISREIALFQAQPKKTQPKQKSYSVSFHHSFHNKLIEMNFGLWESFFWLLLLC